MIAILSDVHANLEALTAVWKDLMQRGATSVYFLGDIVGYGPNPREVLEFVKHFEFSLLGNHDEACLKGPPKSFNAAATGAAHWTRKEVCPDELSGKFFRPGEFKRRTELWEYMQRLQPSRRIGNQLFVHDTPAAPGSWRYVTKREEADAGFAAHPDVRAFFFGHSHRPGIWTERHYRDAEPGQKYPLTERVMFNVGSVGQPRDNDPRACYIILEPDGVRFYRVPYDVAKTQEKILDCPALDPTLALRLGKGQ
ncbi:MAG: metallophosphoesterase [Planctomycetota bacterium]